jgi:hypothetical protein
MPIETGQFISVEPKPDRVDVRRPQLHLDHQAFVEARFKDCVARPVHGPSVLREAVHSAVNRGTDRRPFKNGRARTARAGSES